MAIELINIGNIANDGTGDELRVAFRKINQNFEDLDLRVADAVLGINTGTGVGIYRGRNENDLEFKSLVAGNNVELADNPASIEISVPDVLTETPVITDAGSYVLASGGVIRVFGGTAIDTSLDTLDNSIVITNLFDELSKDTTPELGGTLNAQSNNITNVNRITANEFQGGSFQGNFAGNFTGTVNGINTDVVSSFFDDIDFGGLPTNITSFYEYLVKTIDVDLGTASSPSPDSIDFGGFV